MSQGNQFHQVGYDHYLKAPKKPGYGEAKREEPISFGAKLLHNIQKPAVATVALVAAGVLFAGIIIASYPSGKGAQNQVPIIKADLGPIRSAPQEAGGMVIPNQESTVLAHVGQPENPNYNRPVPDSNAGGHIENLLAPSQDALMSKEQAIENAMAQNPSPYSSDGQQPLIVVESQAPVALLDDEAVGQIPGQAIIAQTETPPPLIEPVATEMKEPTAQDVLQKIGDNASVGQNATGVSSEFDTEVASAALSVKPNAPVVEKPAELHAAGQSPETLDFVRGVLNKQGQGDTVAVANNNDMNVVAAQAAAVEPAVGAAVPAVNITAGTYFVQLASITDPARAGSEWAKMQAKYSVLSASQFRTQEASLSNGTFYRIQAGPMSKSSADEICNALKNEGKPGGCFVTQ